MSDKIMPAKVMRKHSIFIHLRGTLYNSRCIFIIFCHLGRHLEFLKTLNDDRLSSSRIFNGNV